MVQFTATIKRFGSMGEKTGWTHVIIPQDVAQQLIPGNKKSFRVKGKLDDYAIKGIALMPMGDGSFIMPLNAGIRKGIHKKEGAMLQLSLTIDKAEQKLPQDFEECLADEPAAVDFFNSLPRGHRLYFGKWIDSAKTEPTRTKRIAQAVNALSKKMGYPQMIRDLKAKKDELM